MNLSEAVEAYIVHKRSLGMGFRGEAVRLRAFVKAVGDRDMRRVGPAPVQRFLEGAGPITSFWFAKYYTLNAFYRYAVARGYVSKSPLPISTPQKPQTFQPYIYSNHDMREYDRCRRFTTPIRGGCLSRIPCARYCSCSMAPGCASVGFTFNLADFDRAAGVLTIRQTKFFKSRIVPVGPDLNGVLRNYIDRQWSGRPSLDVSPLLATQKGEPILRQTAELASSDCAKKA